MFLPPPEFERLEQATHITVKIYFYFIIIIVVVAVADIVFTELRFLVPSIV